MSFNWTSSSLIDANMDRVFLTMGLTKRYFDNWPASGMNVHPRWIRSLGLLSIHSDVEAKWRSFLYNAMTHNKSYQGMGYWLKISVTEVYWWKGGQVTRQSIREYARAIRDRYWQNSKEGKMKILDEFTKITRLHHKAAIRLLKKRLQNTPEKRGDGYENTVMMQQRY